MEKNQGTLRGESITESALLYVAFELSNNKQKLAFSDGRKMRHATVEAGNFELLQMGLCSAKNLYGMFEDVLGDRSLS